MQFLPPSLKEYVKNLNYVFISPDTAIEKFTAFKPTFFSILYAVYFALIPGIQTLFGHFLQDETTYANQTAVLTNIYLIILYPFCLWLGMGIIVKIISFIFRKKGNFFHYLSGTGFIILFICLIQFFLYLTQYELEALLQVRPPVTDTIATSSNTIIFDALHVLYILLIITFIFLILLVFSFANYVFAKTALFTYKFGLGQQILVLGIGAFLPIFIGPGTLPLSLATYLGGLLMYGTSIYTKNPLEKALFPALYKN